MRPGPGGDDLAEPAGTVFQDIAQRRQIDARVVLGRSPLWLYGDHTGNQRAASSTDNFVKSQKTAGRSRFVPANHLSLNGILTFGGERQGPENPCVKYVATICPSKCWRIVGRICNSRHGGRASMFDEGSSGRASMLAGRTIRERAKAQCAGNGSKLVHVGLQQTFGGGGGKRGHLRRLADPVSRTSSSLAENRDSIFRMLCGERQA